MRVNQKMPVLSARCTYNGLQQRMIARPQCNHDFYRRRIAAIAAIAPIAAVAAGTAIASISSCGTIVRIA